MATPPEGSGEQASEGCCLLGPARAEGQASFQHCCCEEARGRDGTESRPAPGREGKGVSFLPGAHLAQDGARLLGATEGLKVSIPSLFCFCAFYFEAGNLSSSKFYVLHTRH